MNKTNGGRRILLYLAAIVLMTLLCSFGGWFYAWSGDNGVFQPWRRYATSPKKVASLLGFGPTSASQTWHLDALFIKTTQGQVYTCLPADVEGGGCLKAADLPKLSGNRSCADIDIPFPFTRPSGKIVDCVWNRLTGGNASEIRVDVLDENGDVWEWRRNFSEFSGLDPFREIAYGVIGCVVGFLSSSIFAIMWTRRCNRAEN